MFNVPLFVLNNINHRNHITSLSNQNNYNSINRDKRSFPSDFRIDNINENLDKKVGE